MTNDTKQKLKETFSETEATKEPPTKEKEENPQEELEVRRRRGRPSKVHKKTKLDAILKKRGMTRKDLHSAIKEKYPDEPISPDAVSRIVSGRRVYYSLFTLYRICGALNITPNMALDWEDEVV